MANINLTDVIEIKDEIKIGDVIMAEEPNKKPERKFKSPTIGELEDIGLSPAKLEKMEMSWEMLIKLGNACLAEGAPITRETPITELKEVNEGIRAIFLSLGTDTDSD